ncbi:hypothetical protein KKG46_05870 [Patescibacteria group bacterium]|nr:hypothetical protein [Patescibacteria group bacterium]
MESLEQGFNSEQENSIEELRTRLDNLYRKFGIDPKDEVNASDINFMQKATKPGSKEWLQTKLGTLKGMIQKAFLGDKYFQEAEDALKSWEEYEPTK